MWAKVFIGLLAAALGFMVFIGIDCCAGQGKEVTGVVVGEVFHPGYVYYTTINDVPTPQYVPDTYGVVVDGPHGRVELGANGLGLYTKGEPIRYTEKTGLFTGSIYSL